MGNKGNIEYIKQWGLGENANQHAAFREVVGLEL